MCFPPEIRDKALFLIMYTDDAVVFAETKQDLQDMIDYLLQYTSKWKLKINVEENKTVVFRKR